MTVSNRIDTSNILDHILESTTSENRSALQRTIKDMTMDEKPIILQSKELGHSSNNTLPDFSTTFTSEHSLGSLLATASAASSDCPDPPPVFPAGRSSSFLISKPRQLHLPIPTQETEMVSIIQRVIQHAKYDHYVNSARSSHFISVASPRRKKEDHWENVEATGSKIEEDTRVEEHIKLLIALHTERKKNLLLEILNLETELKGARSTLEQLIAFETCLKEGKIHGKYEHEEVKQESNIFPLHEIRGSLEVPIFDQIDALKRSYEAMISEMGSRMQHDFEQQSIQILSSFEQEKKSLLENISSIEMEMRNMEERWKREDLDREKSVAKEDDKVKQITLMDDTNILNKFTSNEDYVGDGEEIESDVDQHGMNSILRSRKKRLLESQRKSVSIREKEMQIEKLNESKSELVWLLKEVIIAEKKRKLLENATKDHN